METRSGIERSYLFHISTALKFENTILLFSAVLSLMYACIHHGNLASFGAQMPPIFAGIWPVDAQNTQKHVEGCVSL